MAITNVRVFDGEKLTEPTTVVFENGIFTSVGKKNAKADVVIEYNKKIK